MRESSALNSMALDADVGVTLYRDVSLDDQRSYVRWSGWTRRLWPLRCIAPGLKLYGFDTEARCLRLLLEATRAGSFEYNSWRDFAKKVQAIWEKPDPDSPHREKMQFGRPGKPCFGYVIECRTLKEVSIPWDVTVPQIGWFRLRKGMEPHVARDIGRLPRRSQATVSRLLRDTALTHRLKRLHGHQCQVCGKILKLCDGTAYSEAHHIVPLGQPHDGPDEAGNILVLCPNCHALCDLGGMKLSHRRLRSVPGHEVSQLHLAYHNAYLRR